MALIETVYLTSCFTFSRNTCMKVKAQYFWFDSDGSSIILHTSFLEDWLFSLQGFGHQDEVRIG